MGQILLDHPLSYALTSTADVPIVYLQQFWMTVSKVPDTKDTIRFNLDIQEITYTMDMFHDTLHLPVETPDNPFVAPVTIEIIESFMQRVGCQGVVDKDYHSIKDDIPLVSMYTTGNVTVRGMLILDAFLTDEIHATDDYKEYETVFIKSSKEEEEAKCWRDKFTTKSLKVTIKQKKVVEGEKDEESYADKFVASMLHDDVDDSEDRIEPMSHKEHSKVVDNDDENKDEKKDEKKDDEMGSLENRTEKMQTSIPTTSRSPRINLSSDKTFVQELTDTVSPQTATTSKDSHKKRRISSNYSHLLRVLRRMCRRQGYMIRDTKRKCVTTDEFWKVHGKVDQVLHEIVPQLSKRATNDLIEGNLKRVVADTIIQERDAFQSDNNVIQVHPTTTTSTDTTSLVDLQQQLYLKMKSNLQDQANDPSLWDVLKQDDAPPEGEKRVKRHKTSKSSKSASEWDAWEEETVIDEDEVIPEDETPELIMGFQNVDKRVQSIFNRARMEATLNDILSNQFRNAEEYAYHLEQATNFMENQIVWESRQEDIRRSIPKALVFYGPHRNLNEPLRYLYNKDLFFLMNGNTEEKKYILSLYKIHAELFLEADLEE
ncbi:hypothetical protein Tco_1111412 [Tanacetum coccineum]|uniref:Uncharacterized protein n=1 Tax=Tanacetum coccineum TaxID=301880 RepID=A0ABQ5ILJ2_9ASTR